MARHLGELEKPDSILSGKTILLVIDFKRALTRKQDDYRVIALDLRGFGESGHPGDVQNSATFGDMAGDVYCVLEQAGVVGDVICLGSVAIWIIKFQIDDGT